MKEKLENIICASIQINGCIHSCNNPPCAMVKCAVSNLLANGVIAQQWTPASEPPKKNGRYLCRYVFNDNYDIPFEQVLTYYATDETPHFQNEGDELGMKVTHWMSLPDEPEEEHTLTIDEVPGPFCSFIMGCDI